MRLFMHQIETIQIKNIKDKFELYMGRGGVRCYDNKNFVNSMRGCIHKSKNIIPHLIDL